MSDKIEDIKKNMADGGYHFSQAEWETVAIKILALKESGEFEDLSEEELVGAFGGLTTISKFKGLQPMYGVIYWPPEEYPKPHPKPWPQPQPLYGIVINPLDPPVQALYGVVAPEELQ